MLPAEVARQASCASAPCRSRSRGRPGRLRCRPRRAARRRRSACRAGRGSSSSQTGPTRRLPEELAVRLVEREHVLRAVDDRPSCRCGRPAIDTLEKPAPSPFATKISRGPPGCHDFRRPVSFESASRFGPRHCGQAAGASAASRAAAAAMPATTRTQRRASIASCLDCVPTLAARSALLTTFHGSGFDAARARSVRWAPREAPRTPRPRGARPLRCCTRTSGFWRGAPAAVRVPAARARLSRRLLHAGRALMAALVR